ncbi:MAG: hypothetical protein AB1414_12055 [bacterium]
MTEREFELDDNKRIADLFERFIREFSNVPRGKSEPGEVLKTYLEAMGRVFRVPCIIRLRKNDEGEIRVVYLWKEETVDININENDTLEQKGFVNDVFEKFKEEDCYVAKNEIDSNDPLSKKGITSCCAIYYQYQDKKEIFLLCNWLVSEWGSQIESYEAKLGMIIMELLVAEVNVEWCRVNEQKYRKMVEDARKDGSRTRLYVACREYINFCEEHGLKQADDILSDYIETTINIWILPARQPEEQPDVSFKEINERLLSKLDSPPLELFNCFRKKDEGIKEMIFEEFLVTILSLSRALAILGRESPNSDDAKRYLKKAKELFKKGKKLYPQDKNQSEELWSNPRLLCFQTVWTLIASQCEVIKRFSVTSKKVKKVENLCIKIVESTREFLWELLSSISEDNKKLSDKYSPEGGINIESLWLKAWFCAYLLKKDVLDKFLADSSRSPLARLSFCYNLSIFILYILHRRKTSEVNAPVVFFYTAEGATLSFIYLLTEYGHSYCKIPRSIRIGSYMRKLWEMESVLYLSHSSYRDHIFHSFDVSLLGLLLLHTYNSKGMLLEKIPMEKETLLGSWLIASLFHDIGYIFSIYDSAEKIGDFFENESIKKSIGIIKEAIENAKNSIGEVVEKNLKMSIKKEDGLDHGHLSAIHLQELLESSSVKSTLVERYQSAIDAVLTHGVKGEEISCKNFPLSFLLLLCDHLQDWGRPRLDIHKFRRSVATYLDYPQPLEIDAYRIMAYLSLNIAIDKDKETTEFESEDFEFTLVYKSSKAGNFEPVMLWIDTFFDLQRVKEMNLWKKIQFNIIIPKSESEILEIDWAKDFVIEDKIGARLATWLSAITSKGSVTNAEGYECFTMKIEEGKESEKIEDLRPKGLYTDYVKWKRQKEEQMSLGGISYQSNNEE